MHENNLSISEFRAKIIFNLIAQCDIIAILQSDHLWVPLEDYLANPRPLRFYTCGSGDWYIITGNISISRIIKGVLLKLTVAGVWLFFESIFLGSL